MNRKILGVTLLALSALCAFGATGRSAVGSWKLDLSKSSYGKAPAPKFEQMTITTDDTTALKWTISGATADGKAFTVGYDGPIDSQFHAVMRNDGTTVAYKRDSDGHLSWTVKDKDGNVIETASGHLSPDGNALTLTGTRSSQRGSTEFVSVFTRAQ